MLRSWLAKRKARKLQALFDRGFDYAAGQLLRGEDYHRLEQEADAIDRNSFDHGVEAALSCWRAVRRK